MFYGPVLLSVFSIMYTMRLLELLDLVVRLTEENVAKNLKTLGSVIMFQIELCKSKLKPSAPPLTLLALDCALPSL